MSGTASSSREIADSSALDSLLRAAARSAPQRPALSSDHHPHENLTFAQLDERSAALAGKLAALGMDASGSIAIWLPNEPAWFLFHLAAARLGLLSVPINTWCRVSEVAHLVELGQCQAVIIDSSFRGIDFVGILNKAIEELRAQGRAQPRWVIDVARQDSQLSHLAAYTQGVAVTHLWALDARPLQQPPREHPALIAYSTSGTTSAPKLAVHRESVVLAHAEAVARAARISVTDVALGVLPPCGAYGYGLVMAALCCGAQSILVQEFTLERIMQLIATERPTLLAITEPLLRQLLEHPQASRETFKSLRVVFCAGGTLESVVARAELQYGVHVTNVYGSSEALALTAFWPLETAARARAAAGGRLVSEAMRVRAADTDGTILLSGKQGELQFSGPNLTCGYLANDTATAQAWTADGWFRSQDLGSTLDEHGREFVYVARMNDAVRLKGFLVSPGEIEAMLQSFPGVRAAQVVGVPDASGEEIAAAFVTAVEGATLDPQALRAFCRERMASYKIPTLLEIIEQFPMTRSANGDKVQKTRLRDMARRMLEDA